jgi:hypothetical protein
MNRILIFLLLTTYSTFGQDIVWNESETIGLVPAKKWIKTSEGESLNFKLTAPFSSDPFKGNLGISTAPTLNWTLDELWTEYVTKGFPISVNGYKKIDEGESRVDGEKSRWIEFYSENQGIKFQGYSEIFIKDNVMYIVTLTSIPKYYDEIESDFKKMINSIEIKTVANKK